MKPHVSVWNVFVYILECREAPVSAWNVFVSILECRRGKKVQYPPLTPYSRDTAQDIIIWPIEWRSLGADIICGGGEQLASSHPPPKKTIVFPMTGSESNGISYFFS